VHPRVAGDGDAAARHAPADPLDPARVAANLQLLPAAALLAFALLGSAASARTEPERTVPAVPAAITFAISGHGWGHGVGMGQYGAYGYARHGWTYDRILAHYYRATSIGTVSPKQTVRVLLATGAALGVLLPLLPALRHGEFPFYILWQAGFAAVLLTRPPVSRRQDPSSHALSAADHSSRSQTS